jgi:hypothetical protein
MLDRVSISDIPLFSGPFCGRRGHFPLRHRGSPPEAYLSCRLKQLRYCACSWPLTIDRLPMGSFLEMPIGIPRVGETGAIAFLACSHDTERGLTEGTAVVP